MKIEDFDHLEEYPTRITYIRSIWYRCKMLMVMNPNVSLAFTVSLGPVLFFGDMIWERVPENLVPENENQGFRPFVGIPETDNVYPIDSYDHSRVAP